jgi:TIR domain-containing protein
MNESFLLEERSLCRCCVGAAVLLTKNAMTATNLGRQLAMYADQIYAERYMEDLEQMRRDLKVLGADSSILPNNAAAYHEQPFDAFPVVLRALSESRSRLGADGYALPFFILHYMLYRAVKHSALGLQFDDERRWISSALEDLNLEAEDEGVKALIRTETLWIQSVNADGAVSGTDVVSAYARLTRRVLSLWRETERRYWQDLPTIGIDYVPEYSCFISFSFADEAFCSRLYERLRLEGVQVWFAPHDMKGGQKTRAQVTAAIGTYDKLLVVLSQSSIRSNWVEHEVYTAFHRERNERRQVLFPIRLIPYDALRQWQAFDADTGRDLAREVREYFIPDFSNWKDDASFDAAAVQLLASLRKSDETPKDDRP